MHKNNANLLFFSKTDNYSTQKHEVFRKRQNGMKIPRNFAS
jgi:hypothetical protein